jgi:hypothetical protein
VTVVALAGCSDDPGGDTAVTLLSLASVSNTSDAAASEARTGDALLASGAVTATITLPAGPTSGTVFRPNTDAVTTARVNDLASSLGVAGQAAELAGGWIVPADADASTAVPGAAPRLIVLKDDVGSWFYGTTTTCDLTVASSGSSCATSSVAVAKSPAMSDGDTDSDAAATAPPGTLSCASDISAARTLAESVLATLGSGAGTPRDEMTRCVATVRAATLVDGTAVEGLSTTVTAEPTPSGPTVVEGAGTLATWSADGAPLPLIDADEALKRLNALPQPAVAELCRPATDGDGCLSTQRSVDAAEPGLMRDTDLTSGTAIVVPAWTFTLRTTLLEPDGTPAPTNVQPTTTSTASVTALDDSVLAANAPTPLPVPPPDDGAGGGTAPGSTGDGVVDVPAVPPLEPGVGEAEPNPATDLPAPVDVPEERGTAVPDPALP